MRDESFREESMEMHDWSMLLDPHLNRDNACQAQTESCERSNGVSSCSPRGCRCNHVGSAGAKDEESLTAFKMHRDDGVPRLKQLGERCSPELGDTATPSFPGLEATRW